MALIDLQFANHSELKKQGRNFDCSSCPLRIQKLRRCHEDRWDFTEDDAAFFPMSVEKGGAMYGFCPAKVNWDNEATTLFNTLVVALEYGKLFTNTDLINQPSWSVDLLAWFAVTYKQRMFISRAQMVLGDGGGSTQAKGVRGNGRNRR